MLSRTTDLKRFIIDKYSLPKEKFEIVKIGPRIWIYLVTKKNTMGRHLLFTGALITVEATPVLKKHLINNIEKGLEKFDYLTQD